MPQLDTSTWSLTIFSMIIALFYFLQKKISTFSYHLNPQSKLTKPTKLNLPWNKKWTKIYLPPSPHQH